MYKVYWGDQTDINWFVIHALNEKVDPGQEVVGWVEIYTPTGVYKTVDLHLISETEGVKIKCFGSTITIKWDDIRPLIIEESIYKAFEVFMF